MPLFTPEDRQELESYLDTETGVTGVGPVSDGLRVEVGRGAEVTNLNGLMNESGWYIDSVEWESRILYIFPMGAGE